MLRWRIVLAVAGVSLGTLGVGRLLTQIPSHSLVLLVAWLIGAIIVHDGIVSPLVLTIGWLLRRFVPDRSRGYLQAGLIMGALVTIIAIPMIHLRNSQPAVKAILRQNFAGNLTLLLGIIAAGTLVLYAIRVARDQSRSTSPPTVLGHDPDDGEHAGGEPTT
jgi:hypothetical protein